MASADRLIEVFNEAKARPAGAERDLFLAEACRDEPQLKDQVLLLLKAHEGAGDFLKNTQAIPPVTVLTEKPGDKIGRYKLLQKIGEGGCGVVYMAEQEEPVRRRVAFKVIKLGMDTRQVVARFEAEGQALAIMDHPNIAKVFDAGATNTGRPYFVMELVRGIKITDYCDQNNLPTEERLKLFTQVCHAIQHAHQKGIIHRDIKPSNILVTVNDGVPVPKVIDFGIAKAIEQRLTDKTVFTAFEQFIGTPAYMSPEQAEMTSLDIDTRADIYSLGVLLYELLSGNTPFDAQTLVASGVAEIRRIIREQEPPKPSTRLNTLNAADRSTVAQHRHTDPPKLMQRIRGDLDWIVMKCLEKDRTRRYETANGLAMDLQRHLDDEPVIARPPSTAYRFQKLVRRNKLAFAATAGIATALAMGVVVSTWQAVRATRAEREQSHLRETAQQAQANEAKMRQQAEGEKEKALTEAAKSQQVAQFMKDMLKGVGPAAALGRDTTMLREILDQTAKRLKDLKTQPAVEADLRATLGNVYSDLGEYTNAAAMHREALALRKKLLGNEHPDVAASLHNLAGVLWKQGRPVEAETMYRETLAMRRKLLGNEHLDVAESLSNLTLLLRQPGKLAEAESTAREALAICKKLLGDEHASVGYALHVLAWNLHIQGKRAEAEALSREELAIWRKLFGNEHPNVGWALGDLTIFLREQGKLAEAETTVREALEIQRKQVGNAPVAAATFLRQLAWVLNAQGKRAEAEEIFREELAIRRALGGNDHPDVAETLHGLAVVLRDGSKLPEAETTLREALAMRRERLGNDHPEVANSLNLLCDLLRAQGKLAELESLLQEQLGRESSATESAQAQFGHLLWQRGDIHLQRKEFTDAERLYVKALQTFKQLQVQFPTNVFYRTAQAYSLRLLSEVMQRTNRLAEAEASLRTAWDIYTQLAKEMPTSTIYPGEAAFTRQRVAEVLSAQGKLDEAEVMCREALAMNRKQFGNEHRSVDQSLANLAKVLHQGGKLTDAEAVWREELAVEKKLSGEEHPFVANSLQSFATVLRDSGKWSEAEAMFREALGMRRKLLGNEHPAVATSLSWLGVTLSDQGKYADAEAMHREALQIRRKIPVEEQSGVASSLNYVGYALRLQGKHAEAEAVYRELLALRRKLSADDPQLAAALAELTQALLVQQKFAEAEPPARECLAIREKKLPDDWLTFNTRSTLGGSLLGQKKYAEAEPLLLSGYQGMKQREDKIPAIGKPRVKETLQRLVQLYEATGQAEKAAEWKKKLAEFDKAEAEKKVAAPEPSP